MPVGLALARLLQRPAAADPLGEPETAPGTLARLHTDPGPVDPTRYAVWRARHAPRPHGDDRPALLAAAAAVRDWMEAGVTDQPSASRGSSWGIA